MRRFTAGGVVLVLALSAAAGCSNTKYTEQIEQQKLEISRLQEKNYQIEMELSRQKAQADEAARRAAQMSPATEGATPVADHPGKGAARGEGERIVLDSSVLFASGSATLTAGGVNAVKGVAAKIKKTYAGHLVRVEGHTDNTPIKRSKFASNEELSTARAEAVAKILAQNGVPEGDIQVVGLGDSKPRASNSTADGRAKNRRVEIIILQ